MTTPPIQTLTDELLGEIEAAAINATQDDWDLIQGTRLSGPEVVANGEPIAWALNSEADAVHIQMSNPAMVLELITELRTLRAETERLKRFESAFNEWHDKTEWVQAESPSLSAKYLGCHRADVMRDIIDSLRAENAELLRVVKDVRWRVWDTTDQLQAYGFNGDRLYGLDEWSVPIRNLNMAVGMLEKAMEQAK
jgi:hypothetical protein